MYYPDNFFKHTSSFPVLLQCISSTVYVILQFYRLEGDVRQSAFCGLGKLCSCFYE